MQSTQHALPCTHKHTHTYKSYKYTSANRGTRTHTHAHILSHHKYYSCWICLLTRASNLWWQPITTSTSASSCAGQRVPGGTHKCGDRSFRVIRCTHTTVRFHICPRADNIIRCTATSEFASGEIGTS
jgi:hypothetical protein